MILLDGELSSFALSNYMKNCNADENGGKVALAPLGDPLVSILNDDFRNCLNYIELIFFSCCRISNYYF